MKSRFERKAHQGLVTKWTESKGDPQMTQCSATDRCRDMMLPCSGSLGTSHSAVVLQRNPSRQSGAVIITCTPSASTSFKVIYWALLVLICLVEHHKYCPREQQKFTK